MTKQSPLYTKQNSTGEMEARVWASTHKGYAFSVTLCDLDSGETLPTARLLNDFEAACKLANSWVAEPTGLISIPL
jgi:hypothetical protein